MSGEGESSTGVYQKVYGTPIQPGPVDKFKYNFALFCCAIRYQQHVLDRNHWDPVASHMVLGGVPLVADPLRSPAALKSDYPSLGLVVSAVQPFELEASNDADAWNAMGVSHVLNQMVDFSADKVNVEDLIAVANDIDAAMKSDRMVYIHCKSGRSRSAVTAGAYFVTHGGLLPKDARQFMLEGRAQVDLHQKHLKVLQRVQGKFFEGKPKPTVESSRDAMHGLRQEKFSPVSVPVEPTLDATQVKLLGAFRHPGKRCFVTDGQRRCLLALAALSYLTLVGCLAHLVVTPYLKAHDIGNDVSDTAVFSAAAGVGLPGLLGMVWCLSRAFCCHKGPERRRTAVTDAGVFAPGGAAGGPGGGAAATAGGASTAVEMARRT